MHYSVAGQAVYGDGIDYWAYLHTWYFDHDINFENEFRHNWSQTGNNAINSPLSPSIEKTQQTPIGKVDDVHPFGVPLLLFPFFVLADVLVIIANVLGYHVARNGYSDVYQIIGGFGAILYAVGGIYFMEKTCKKLGYSPFVSRVACLVIVFATNLLYYLAYDVLNSHFASFFIVSLFWYLFVSKFKQRKPLHYALMGVLIGLATLTRLQDGLLVIPLIAELTYALFIKEISLSRSVLLILAVTIGITLILTPLMLQWTYLYGSMFNYTEFLNLRPHGQPLFDSLLNSRTGLVSTTPLIGALLLALLVVLRKIKQKRLVIMMTLYFIALVLLFARHGGYVGSSYGGRMYISASILFVVVLCWILHLVRNNQRRSKIVAIFLLYSVLFNLVNMGNFILFTKEASGGRHGIEKTTLKRIHQQFPWLPFK